MKKLIMLSTAILMFGGLLVFSGCETAQDGTITVVVTDITDDTWDLYTSAVNQGEDLNDASNYIASGNADGHSGESTLSTVLLDEDNNNKVYYFTAGSTYTVAGFVDENGNGSDDTGERAFEVDVTIVDGAETVVISYNDMDTM